MLPHPKGVRDPEIWYEYLVSHEDYIRAIFERQTEVALKNLELYRQAVGDRIDVLFMSGTDFGTQRGPICSPQLFRSLWKPYFTKLNAWVHQHTPWKIFYHSCGGILPIIPDLIDCGVDILNPVQCSAEGMDAQNLKQKFGDKLTFWGGGVDTQKVLPFGTVADVRKEVAERVEIFSPGGGFVFNTIHNIQQSTPVENILAMYETVRQHETAGVA
jgi:uroporphyrinogen-III decarboxylase